MGKMKQIAEIIRNNDVDLLDRLIKVSERNNSQTVFFIGKTYSIQDAKQILLFMNHEAKRQDQIRREQLLTEPKDDTTSYD